jgi:hypothetical protein
MSETIKDGTGAGFLAKVDSTNRMLVSANSQSEEHFISSGEGLAYFANSADTADTLTTTATGGPILYVRNTHAEKQLVVEKILASTDTAGGVFKWIINPILGTIGNNNVHAPVSLNAGKSITPATVAYNWDEVGDGMTGLTGGTTLKTTIIGAGFTAFPIDSSLILEGGDSIQMNYTGAGEFECSIRFFLMDAEEA